MENKNAQVLGCFIGVLITLIITLPIYSLFNFPVWAEYLVTSVLLIIISTISIVLVSKFSNKIPAQEPPKPQA